MGALDTVLDSNARVTPFRILLQVPGSQTSWVIASGEPQALPLIGRAAAAAQRLCSCVSGAAAEEVNQHWDWLLHNLLQSLSVFENKEDVASFVKGKVKVRSLAGAGGACYPANAPSPPPPVGPHRRGGPEPPGCSGGRPWEVPGGAAEVPAALRPPVLRETGDLLLLLLLEGPGASAGFPLPQHQPPVLLLLPAGEGRYRTPRRRFGLRPRRHGSRSASVPLSVKFVVPWAEVTLLERVSAGLMTEAIRVGTRQRQREFSMFLDMDEAFRVIGQLADIALRRLLDSDGLELDRVLQQPARINKRSVMGGGKTASPPRLSGDLKNHLGGRWCD